MVLFIKAAAMTEPGKIEIQTFERPEVKDDTMLVRIRASGVCGSDVHVFKGHAKGVAFPIIPGHENAGEIAEIGKDAAVNMRISGDPLQEGERVAVCPTLNCNSCYYCKMLNAKPWLCINRQAYGLITCKDPPHLFGGWAEYLYVKPGSTIHRVPKDLPLEVACMAEPTSIASRAVSTAFIPGTPHMGSGFGPKVNVVVQGAGPIGLLVSAVSKMCGAEKVVVLDAIDGRLKAAERFGADYTINIEGIESLNERIALIRRLMNGVGADVVFECAGVPAAFAEGVEYARKGGILVELGHYMDAGTVEINPRTICHKDLTILGAWSSPHKSQFKTALAILASDLFPFKELVTHKFKLENAVKGIETSGKKAALKTVITP